MTSVTQHTVDSRIRRIGMLLAAFICIRNRIGMIAMGISAKVLPALKPGETYTDPDFLLVQTTTDCHGETLVDIERLFSLKREDDSGTWGAKTITSMTKMTRDDAMTLAQAYAESHEIPLIYEQHDIERPGKEFIQDAAAS